MCGIFSFISREPSSIATVLVEGLQKITYRGYDSVGVSVLHNEEHHVIKAVGNMDQLAPLMPKKSLQAHVGIGHIRWATNGSVSLQNAHPVASKHFALVHNGIISNIDDIARRLPKISVLKGETDSEVVVHFCEHLWSNNRSSFFSLERAVELLEGSWALAIACTKNPESLLFARKQSPLIIGEAPEGFYLASDIGSMPDTVTELTFPEDGDYGFVNTKEIIVYNNKKEVVRPTSPHVTTQQTATKGSFSSFLLKEIHEQPDVVRSILKNNVQKTESSSFTPSFAESVRIRTARMHLIACGSSYYASLLGVHWLEKIANIAASPYIASEYYWQCAEDKMCAFISQSGETADILRLFSEPLKPKAKHTMCLINSAHSSLSRLVPRVIPLYAGVERSVASTKAFLSQITTLFLLACAWGGEEGRKHIAKLETLPTLLDTLIKGSYDFLATNIPPLLDINHYIFLSAENLYPIIVEGSLKMKELSYITSTAYTFDNMPFLHIHPHSMLIIVLNKDHEPLAHEALALALQDHAPFVIVITNGPSDLIPPHCLHLETPECDHLVFPMLATPFLQMIALVVAEHRGSCIDQPRNLAKSVTVE